MIHLSKDIFGGDVPLDCKAMLAYDWEVRNFWNWSAKDWSKDGEAILSCGWFGRDYFCEWNCYWGGWDVEEGETIVAMYDVVVKIVVEEV